jgi:hypothetical protein
MKRLAAAALLLCATGVRAEGIHEMQAALSELKIAQDHLRVAGTDYGGHRRTALEYVAKAIKEVHQGIQVARGREDPEGTAKSKAKPRKAAPDGGHEPDEAGEMME